MPFALLNFQPYNFDKNSRLNCSFQDKAQALVDSIAADKKVAEAKLEDAQPALQAARDALKESDNYSHFKRA